MTEPLNIPAEVAKAAERAKSKGDMLAGLWLDLSAPCPEPQPLIMQGDVNVCTRGNFSCITGAAKSRKTWLISAMAGALLRGEFIGLLSEFAEGAVLYLDTEQSLPHVQRVIRRIHRIAGYDLNANNSRLRVLCLRELEPKKRIEALQEAMRRVKPDFVVVDGISDLMTDTNDNKESVAISTLLLQLTTQYDCHIMTAIHTNPSGDKARGHIGSEIMRKAETVLSVRKEGGASRVIATHCRDMEIAEFAFCVGLDGLPQLTESPMPTAKANKMRDVFESLLPGDRTLPYSDLREKLMIAEGVSRPTASRKIKVALDTGVIAKDLAGNYHCHVVPQEDENTLPF